MKLRMYLFLAIVLSLGSEPADAQSYVIDGVFDEWTTTSQVATDIQGDATGAFDITFVSAKSETSNLGRFLYIHFDIGRTLNLQNGDESDGTLKLKLEANEKVLDIDFRARTATDETGSPVSWQDIRFQCLPTFATDKVELRIDLERFKAEPDDRVSLQFAGSDSLDRPIEIPIAESSSRVQPDNFKWTKDPDVFRVASQNTLHNGLVDETRQEKFERLFKAVKADVYCFQEEWDKPKYFSGVGETVPRVGSVYVVWNGGRAIATTHKLNSLPMNLDWAAAGLVTPTNGNPIVVISVHLECCGYAGSKQDILRIQQTKQIIGQVNRMRAGVFGEVVKTAPIILAGDINLVGSRTPLDLINAAGLNDVACRAVDGSAATWRGLRPEEGFWSGRLDIVAHSAMLNPRQSVILDSKRLPAKSLSELGLHPDDSLASDHLMLVSDFETVGN